MEINFEPLGKRVVVTRHIPKTGMMLTPEMQREAYPDIGVICKVGQIGLWNKYIRGVKVGKKIAFTRFSPVAIRDEEAEHMFVDLENILGIEQ